MRKFYFLSLMFLSTLCFGQRHSLGESDIYPYLQSTFSGNVVVSLDSILKGSISASGNLYPIDRFNTITKDQKYNVTSGFLKYISNFTFEEYIDSLQINYFSNSKIQSFYQYHRFEPNDYAIFRYKELDTEDRIIIDQTRYYDFFCATGAEADEQKLNYLYDGMGNLTSVINQIRWNYLAPGRPFYSWVTQYQTDNFYLNNYLQSITLLSIPDYVMLDTVDQTLLPVEKDTFIYDDGKIIQKLVKLRYDSDSTMKNYGKYIYYYFGDSTIATYYQWIDNNSEWYLSNRRINFEKDGLPHSIIQVATNGTNIWENYGYQYSTHSEVPEQINNYNLKWNKSNNEWDTTYSYVVSLRGDTIISTKKLKYHGKTISKKIYDTNNNLIYESESNFNLDNSVNYIYNENTTYNSINLPEYKINSEIDFNHTNQNFDSTMTFTQYFWHKDLIENTQNSSKGTSISISPNPSQGIINISGEENIDHIIVYNLDGILALKTNAFRIDISNLPAGPYFIKVFTKDNRLYNLKFIKT